MKSITLLLLISIILTFITGTYSVCPGLTSCSGRGQCQPNNTCICDSPYTSDDCTDILPNFVNRNPTGFTLNSNVNVDFGFYIKDLDYYGITRNFYMFYMSNMTIVSKDVQYPNYTQTVYHYQIVSQVFANQQFSGYVDLVQRNYTRDVVTTYPTTSDSYTIYSGSQSYTMNFYGPYRNATSTYSFRLHVIPILVPTEENGSFNYQMEHGSLFYYKWVNMTSTTQTSSQSLYFRAISIGVTGNNENFQYSPTQMDQTETSNTPISFAYARTIYAVSEDTNCSLSFDFRIDNNNNGGSTSTSSTSTTTTTTSSTSTSTSNPTTTSSSTSTSGQASSSSITKPLSIIFKLFMVLIVSYL